uniref:Permuted papain-like amidase enzyme, YaeF/YiiX, C92 family n=1 Tax=Panagrellus redivivus TaxID=6233 RepID=A0A7E4VL72_PANRE
MNIFLVVMAVFIVIFLKLDTQETRRGALIHGIRISNLFIGFQTIMLNAMNFPDLGRDAPGSIVFFLRTPPETPSTSSKSFSDAVCAVSKFDKSVFHVGLLTDSDTLIHATCDFGVVKQSLEDAVLALEPTALEFYTASVSPQRRRKAIKFAKQCVGAAYNDVFDPLCFDSVGRKAFYCCQLVATAYGRHLFPPHRLIFSDSEGKLIPYWVKYFEKRGRLVPEGAPGSHPSVIRAASILTFRAAWNFLAVKSRMPRNLVDRVVCIRG